tara:strand:- start:1346 stop:1852 length:507 start_codon:yes stop_codon:yes gene_type:complete
MPGQYEATETITLVLNQSSCIEGSGTYNDCTFFVKVGGIQENYDKYRLFVDNFCCHLTSLALTGGVQVRLNIHNQTSYNSSENGPNTVVASIADVGDNAINYQASSSPIDLSAPPLGTIKVRITNFANAEINLLANTNTWSLTLRCECYRTSKRFIEDLHRVNHGHHI